MKPEPTIAFDTLMKASIVNLRRLARSIGISVRAVGAPDEKYKVAVAISRWYKRNPQPKRRPRMGRRDRLHRN
jgi:hypothetical protein